MLDQVALGWRGFVNRQLFHNHVCLSNSPCWVSMCLVPKTHSSKLIITEVLGHRLISIMYLFKVHLAVISLTLVLRYLGMYMYTLYCWMVPCIHDKITMARIPSPVLLRIPKVFSSSEDRVCMTRSTLQLFMLSYDWIHVRESAFTRYLSSSVYGVSCGQRCRKRPKGPRAPSQPLNHYPVY